MDSQIPKYKLKDLSIDLLFNIKVILDSRLNNKVSEKVQEELLVICRKTDKQNMRFWIKRADIIKVNQNQIMLLIERFDYWYNTERFGYPPTITKEAKIPGIKIDGGHLWAAYDTVNFLDLNGSSPCGRIIYYKLIALLNQNFNFYTGFQHYRGIDRRIMEFKFWYDTLKAMFAAQKLINPDYQISKKIYLKRGHYQLDYKWVNAAIQNRYPEMKSFGYKSIKQSKPRTLRYPRIIFCSESNDIRKNFNTVLVLIPGQSGLVYVPLYSLDFVGFNKKHTTEVAQLWGYGNELYYYYDGHDSRGDTIIRCLQFVSELLDGAPLQSFR